VEFLLMKALALHLIEGSIDQVRPLLSACPCVGRACRGCCAVLTAGPGGSDAPSPVSQRLLPAACVCGLPCASQVSQEVTVSWVASRVLTTVQVQGLKERLDGWISKVNAISNTLEQESIGVALEVV
jgi:hypothetical protein